MNLHFGAFAALIRFLPTDQCFHKQHRVFCLVFCFLVFLILRGFGENGLTAQIKCRSLIFGDRDFAWNCSESDAGKIIFKMLRDDDWH